MPDIELKQLSLDMEKPEYDMLVKIMLKNGGQIIGDFKNQKHIIRIPIE